MRSLRRFRQAAPLAGAVAAVLLTTACEERALPTIATTVTNPTPDTTVIPGPVTTPLLLEPGQAALTLGDTLRLVVSNSGGATLRWTSSVPSVAVIQSTSGTTALIRAVGTGTTSIAAAIAADTTRRATATISVTP